MLPLPRQPASHVIVHRETGKAVQEVFGPRPVLAAPVAEAFEVVPILEWLQRVAVNPERYTDATP